MRNPETLNQTEINVDQQTVIKFDKFPEYDIVDWDFDDKNDFKKYIKTVESLVRTSFHYTNMIAYMRENMNMNKCAIFKNVSKINRNKISIHVHHDPFDLYTICLIVFNKRKTLGESLSERMVAKEVMWLHYSALIGLIPLSETVHELVHNKYLFIPTTHVMGRYKQFVEIYKPYMLPEQIETLETIEAATDTFNSIDYKALLEKHYIYVDLSGAIEAPKYEEIMDAMKERISYLKHNPTMESLTGGSVPPLQLTK